MPWIVAVLALAVGVSVLMSTLAFAMNSRRVDDINQERASNVERNCLDVNRRHDATLAALDRLLADRIKDAAPAERSRLEASREATALLIEALVPKRDCSALVAQQVTP